MVKKIGKVLSLSQDVLRNYIENIGDYLYESEVLILMLSEDKKYFWTCFGVSGQKPTIKEGEDWSFWNDLSVVIDNHKFAKGYEEELRKVILTGAFGDVKEDENVFNRCKCDMASLMILGCPSAKGGVCRSIS